MRAAKQVWRAISFAGLGLLPACGVLLDFPDTRKDDNYGKADSGFYADGAPIGDGGGDGTTSGDGSATDGSTGSDGSIGTCGPDHKDCHGGVCNGTSCEPVKVTSSVMDPEMLATDGTSLFAISGTSDIWRVDLGSPDSPVNIANSQNDLASMVVAPPTIYFTSTSDGRISSCPTSGCGAGLSRIDYKVSSSFKPVGIAVSTTTLYFAGNDPSSGAIYSCPLGTPSCSPTSVVAAHSAKLLQIDLPSSSLYWTANGDQGVFHCSIASCTGASSGSFSIAAITFDASNIYYVTDDSIFIQPKGMSAVQHDSNTTNPVGIGVDSQYIYWLAKNDTSGSNGALSRCTIATGCNDVTAMVTGLEQPRSMLILGDTIFYSTSTNNTISRITK